ncbi:unnamed protein product [Calypogeia fissa]
MWKDPAECIISDELGIFADSCTVTVLDEIYDVKLVRKFFSRLKVPQKASGAVYRRIWLEWSRKIWWEWSLFDMVMDKEACLQYAALVDLAKVQHVLKDILRNWQSDSSKDLTRGSSSMALDKDSRSTRVDAYKGDIDTSKTFIDDPSGNPSDTDSRKDSGQDSGGTDSSNDSGQDSGGTDSSNDSGDDSSSTDSRKDPRDDSSTADSMEDLGIAGAKDDSSTQEVWKSFLAEAWICKRICGVRV